MENMEDEVNNSLETKQKKISKVLIIIMAIVLMIVLIFLFVFRNEIRTISSMKKIDDYGMYQMKYYGSYDLDGLLKQGISSDEELQDFIIKELTHGIPVNIDVTGGGCTAFVYTDKDGRTIMGRNFDFSYAPSLQVFTNPEHGYASVSTINLAFAGYGENNLPDSFANSFLALAAPYLTFDGMNEKGVAVCLLAVPEADNPSTGKTMINTSVAMRMILDKAANMNEAIDLLKQYDIYFSGNIPCHFLLADSSGKSVIIEYYGGGLQVVESDESFQVASNFIAYNDLNIGEGFDEFDRYNSVHDYLKQKNCDVSEDEAMALLAEVGVMDDGVDKLQWSVVYNLNDLSGEIFAHRKNDQSTRFELEFKK